MLDKRFSELCARLFSIFLFVGMAACTFWVIPKLKITTSMTHFLPEGAPTSAKNDSDESSREKKQNSKFRLSKLLLESELNHTSVLCFSGLSEAQLLRSAQDAREAISLLPGVKWVQSGLSQKQGEDFFSFLLEQPPYSFLSQNRPDPSQAETRINELKESLSGPFAPLRSKVAPYDPLGGMWKALEHFSSTQSQGLTNVDSILTSQDGKYAFVFVSTNASGLDGNQQRQFLDTLEIWLKEQQKTKPQLRLELSSVAKYSASSEMQIREDIERIGVFSTIGIVFLFVFMFRSIRMLFLGLTSLVFGSAFALCVCHFIFGQIHGLTLAFGTSLLGVGMDYAEHFFSHFALEPHKKSSRVFFDIWPGLWVGALTTVIGLFGLMWTHFPGIREMAWFAVFSILGSLFGTRFLIVPWMPKKYAPPSPPSSIAQKYANYIQFFLASTHRKKLGVVAILLTATLSLAGLHRIQFEDHPKALLQFDPAIVQEDKQVRERITSFDSGRFIVVADTDLERALQKLEHTTRNLYFAQKKGWIKHFFDLTFFFHSQENQKQSYILAKESAEKVRHMLQTSGFNTSLFEPYFQSLDKPWRPSASIEEWLASPLGFWLSTMVLKTDGQYQFIVPIAGFHPEDLTEDLKLEPMLDEATLIDQSVILSTLYADVRVRTVQMMLVGLLLVFFTLLLRYKKWSTALSAFLPAAISAICTLSILSLAGQPIHLLHMMALLMVLSMGVDYGVFVVEGRHSLLRSSHSFVSIFTATITTLLSFGLLAFSREPALRSLGITISLGTLLSFLFCPAGILFRPPDSFFPSVRLRGLDSQSRNL